MKKKNVISKPTWQLDFSTSVIFLAAKEGNMLTA